MTLKWFLCLCPLLYIIALFKDSIFTYLLYYAYDICSLKKLHVKTCIKRWVLPLILLGNYSYCCITCVDVMDRLAGFKYLLNWVTWLLYVSVSSFIKSLNDNYNKLSLFKKVNKILNYLTIMWLINPALITI